MITNKQHCDQSGRRWGKKSKLYTSVPLTAAFACLLNKGLCAFLFVLGQVNVQPVLLETAGAQESLTQRVLSSLETFTPHASSDYIHKNAHIVFAFSVSFADG